MIKKQAKKKWVRPELTLIKKAPFHLEAKKGTHVRSKTA